MLKSYKIQLILIWTRSYESSALILYSGCNIKVSTSAGEVQGFLLGSQVSVGQDKCMSLDDFS